MSAWARACVACCRWNFNEWMGSIDPVDVSSGDQIKYICLHEGAVMFPSPLHAFLIDLLFLRRFTLTPGPPSRSSCSTQLFCVVPCSHRAVPVTVPVLCRAVPCRLLPPSRRLAAA